MSDSTPALAYLAVAFAASGHDQQAASAFQTSLVDGSDLPQIFAWLGETLMRTHDLSGARSIFEEAVGKWPADAASPARLRCCMRRLAGGAKRSGRWSAICRSADR